MHFVVWQEVYGTLLEQPQEVNTAPTPPAQGACPGLSAVQSHADAPKPSSFIITCKWLGACTLTPGGPVQLQHKMCNLGNVSHSLLCCLFFIPHTGLQKGLSSATAVRLERQDSHRDWAWCVRSDKGCSLGPVSSATLRTTGRGDCACLVYHTVPEPRQCQALWSRSQLVHE